MEEQTLEANIQTGIPAQENDGHYGSKSFGGDFLSTLPWLTEQVQGALF